MLLTAYSPGCVDHSDTPGLLGAFGTALVLDEKSNIIMMCGRVRRGSEKKDLTEGHARRETDEGNERRRGNVSLYTCCDSDDDTKCTRYKRLLPPVTDPLRLL